jgi:hypothetical protein
VIPRPRPRVRPAGFAMRLPALSYAVEAVLGAGVAVLGFVVAWPDEPGWPKPVVAAPAPAAPHGLPAARPPGAAQPAPADPARALADKEAAEAGAAKVAAARYPLKYDPVRARDVRARHVMAFRAQTVGAFEQTPGRDAPWADLARAALDLRARDIAHQQLADEQSSDLAREARAAIAKAVEAGCDDPLVAYWHLRNVSPNTVPRDPAVFRAAVERVYASSYPAVRRIHAVHNWIMAAHLLAPYHPARADLPEWEVRYWDLLAAAARERDLVVDEELVDLAEMWQSHRKDHGGSREQALSEWDRHLRRAGAREYLRRTVRGIGLVRLAWDARGGGVASTVTEEGWREFSARLLDARETLADAADADPDGYSAPTAMLSVCMGMGLERVDMEFTFRDAMAANPDNRQACAAKLECLHPKWFGGEGYEEFLAFAWVLALHPGDGRLGTAALASLTSNFPVAGPRYEASRDWVTQFYSKTEVWAVVRTAAERTLREHPGDTYTLNLLARMAVLAGRNGEAAGYFERIGTDFSPRVFVDQNEYHTFRGHAGLPPPRR